jgi:hypothetical protein
MEGGSGNLPCMTFIGRLKKNSHIYSTWRGSRRIQGVISTATFRLAPGMEYVTDVLTPGQVTDLRQHPCVQVEMVGALPEVVADAIRIEPVPVPVNVEAARPPVQPTFTPRHQYHPPRGKAHRR